MIIYKATNTINGKSYIGQSKNGLEHRKKEHIRAAIKRKHVTMILHKAIRKYGKNVFQWEVLCECTTLDELNEKEKHYIQEYDTFKNGYNSTTGGDGYELSDKLKQQIGNRSKEYQKINGNPFQGKHHSEESKALFKKSIKEYYKTHNHINKGIPRTKEVKEKISKVLKEYWNTHPNPNIGKPLSEKTKKLIGAKTKAWIKKNGNAFKGKHHTEETKQILREKQTEYFKTHNHVRKGKHLDNEYRMKLRAAANEFYKHNEHPFKGGKQSNEAKRKMQESWKNRLETTCPYCGKTGKNNMVRYHFDNCKSK